MVREMSPYPCSSEAIYGKLGPQQAQWPQVLPAGQHWRKVKSLGEALFGKVYLMEALTPHFLAPGSHFALKIMPKSKVLAGNRGLESPLNELGAAQYLHWMQATDQQLQGVAKIYFVAQDEANFYLASEFCKEGELYTVLKTLGKIGGEALRVLMLQLLRSVAALHEVGIAHRDISIENVLLHEDGKVRLIDFGQSLLLHAPTDTNREATVQPSPCGEVSGKRFYRAPEARLTHCIPHSAKKLDVFACGVLLFVLAFGGYPFDPANYSSMFPEEEMESDRCHGLRRRLQKKGLANEDSTEPFIDLMEQMMAPNPEKRLSAREALSHPWLIEVTASSDL